MWFHSEWNGPRSKCSGLVVTRMPSSMMDGHHEPRTVYTFWGLLDSVYESQISMTIDLYLGWEIKGLWNTSYYNEEVEFLSYVTMVIR